MTGPIIVTGDLTSIEVELTVAGEAIQIGQTTSVKAALVSLGRTEVYVAAVDQAWTSGWADGVVTITLAETDTADIAYQGRALVEIQVDPGSAPRTWFLPVQIFKGNIE